MAENRSLFDGADVIGVGWAQQPRGDVRKTDIAELRRWADETVKIGAPDSTTDSLRAAATDLLRAAADEIEALRAEVLALKKGNATLSRKAAALQKIADGKGLDVTTAGDGS